MAEPGEVLPRCQPPESVDKLPGRPAACGPSNPRRAPGCDLEPRNRLHTSGPRPGDDWDYTITGLSAVRLHAWAADTQAAHSAAAPVLAGAPRPPAPVADAYNGPAPRPAPHRRPSSARACVHGHGERPGPGWDCTSTGLSARRLQTQAADAAVAKEARAMQLSAKQRTLSRQGQRRALPPRCATPGQLAQLCRSADPRMARAAQLATKLGIGTWHPAKDAWSSQQPAQPAGQSTVRDAKYSAVHFSERGRAQTPGRRPSCEW
mmetsp:Transcript_57968/g.164717  ORF Transcript_57968/g.164717 Transcript_57968/m.164717 type:complete len:263 (-) Transcript_57968:180-968(-)